VRIKLTARTTWVVAAAAMLAGLAIPAVAAPAAPSSDRVPHYNHIVVIMDNGESYRSILHNPFAPTINRLASEYGEASRYYTTSDPDTADIMALIAGNDFGIDDHLPYWDTPITSASLLSQLDGAHMSWKEYIQNLPYPGYLGDCYPTMCLDTDTLYKQQKFNSVPDLTSVADNPTEARKLVPDTELGTDARTGKLPNFSFVVPSECYDMHGGPPWCEDSPNAFRQRNDDKLVSAGDGYVKKIVTEVMSGPQWRHGNNAIVITLTEGTTSAGCCDVNPGTGRVLTVVVTNHGRRHIVDSTPFNHYSLLLTIEDAFRLPCLAHACDAGLVPLAKLFGAAADPAATHASAAGRPRPQAAVRPTARHGQAAGGTGAKPAPTPSPATVPPSPWTVVKTPNTGSNDNDLAAISGRSRSDIWAVGGLLPSANATIVQTLALHYNGHSWSRVRTANVGTEANSFYGVAALPDGTAWATGIYTQDSGHTGRALTEHWNGHRWSAVPAANPGSQEDMLYSVSAVSDSDVWAVGTYSGPGGMFHPLVEHWNGSRWSVVSVPGLRARNGILTSVSSAAGHGTWATGQLTGSSAPDHEVLLHLVGGAWKVSEPTVRTPASAIASGYPQGIAASRRGPWVAGNDRAGHDGFSTLVQAPGTGAHLSELTSPDPTPQDNYLAGITAVNGGRNAWAVGESIAVESQAGSSLIEYGSASGGWEIVPSPNPGAANGNTYLFGVQAFGAGDVWAVGAYDGTGGMRTLIMHDTGGA
jgi:hypothetical protein